MESGKSPDRPNLYDRPIFAAGAPRAAQRGPVAPRPNRRLSLNAKLLLFALAVMAALGAAVYSALRPEEERYVLDTFQYATVGVRDFRNVVRTSGRFFPSEIAAIKAPAEATVVEVYREVGDDVTAGALLARLRSESLEQELESARLAHEIALIEIDQVRLEHAREVASARSKVEEAEAELAEEEERLPVMEALYALGGIPRQELEASRRAVEEARAALAYARESLAIAERQAELAVKKAEQQEATARTKLAEVEERAAKMEVRAPWDGRLLELSIKSGSLVEEGATLLRLADVTSQQVEAVVTPEQASGIQPGAPALLRTSDAAYPAQVVQVAMIATTGESGTQVPVRLSVTPEVSAAFLPNAPVTVEIELGALKDRPFLRRGPFFSSGNASFVYVLSDDLSTAERRDVRYGAIDGDYVEVVSGVEPGERVIYSSYTAFRSYRTIDLIPEGGRPVE